MSLILDVFTDYIRSDFITYAANKVTIVPQFPSPKLLPDLRIFLEYLSGRNAFHYLHNSCRRIPRRYLNKYVNMVFHHFHGIYHQLIFLRYPLKYPFQILPHLSTQYILPVFRYPNHVILKIIYGMLYPSYPHAAVILNIDSLRQIPLPRLTASHFHPASKLTGIQWKFL